MENLKEYQIRNIGYFDSRQKLRYADGEFTPDRRINCYEIELFLNDGGEAFINQVGYEIKKGYVLVAKPNQIRHSKLHFKAAYLHIEVYGEYMKSCFDKIPDFFKLTHSKECVELIGNIFDAINRGLKNADLYVTGKVYELLYLLSAESEEEDYKDDTAKELVLCAKKYIDENYEKPITLSDMAGTVNLNPVYFHRVFKNAMGITPGKYLQNIRLSTAKKLLEVTGKPIEEISFLCGFSSQAYFSDFFKRKTGLSPVQFRKEQLRKYKI